MQVYYIAKKFKSLRMKNMKYLNFFLLCLILTAGCQKQEEEMIDLDQMALVEDETDTGYLAGDPLETPQETLIKESVQN